MERTRIVLWLLMAAVMVQGCKKQPPPQRAAPAPKPPKSIAPAAGNWVAEKIATIEAGLVAPESILPDAGTGQIFVSNIETQTGGYWEDDGKGFISLINADGTVKTLRWLDSKEGVTLNAPKGMCVLDGKLYFTDNTKLKRCDAGSGENPENMKLPGEQLNDIATDGQVVWVSDVKAGKIFRVEAQGGFEEVKSPASVNGVTCWNGKLFAVSWDLHDIYEIDPAGEKEPAAFGLADNFQALDGIEVLDDGTFVVSDNTGGKICTVSPDRKTVRTLVEAEGPADIGVDRKAGILYVPQVGANKAVLYKLTQK